MTKHSRGPWTGGRECINAPDGRLIAEVLFYNAEGRDPMTHAEFVANSKLIAAAPDMLDALKSAKQIIHQAHHYGPIETCDQGVCINITPAINKAEGRL